MTIMSRLKSRNVIVGRIMRSIRSTDNPFSVAVQSVPLRSQKKIEKTQDYWPVGLSILNSEKGWFDGDRLERRDTIGISETDPSTIQTINEIKEIDYIGDTKTIAGFKTQKKGRATTRVTAQIPLKTAYFINVRSETQSISFQLNGATKVNVDARKLPGLPADSRYESVQFGQKTYFNVELTLEGNYWITPALICILLEWSEALIKPANGVSIFFNTPEAQVIALALSLYINRYDTQLFEKKLNDDSYDLNDHFSQVIHNNYQNTLFPLPVKRQAVHLTKLMVAATQIDAIQADLKALFDGADSHTLDQDDQKMLDVLSYEAGIALKVALTPQGLQQWNNAQSYTALEKALIALHDNERVLQNHLIQHSKGKAYKPSVITETVTQLFELLTRFREQDLLPGFLPNGVMLDDALTQHEQKTLLSPRPVARIGSAPTVLRTRKNADDADREPIPRYESLEDLTSEVADMERAQDEKCQTPTLKRARDEQSQDNSHGYDTASVPGAALKLIKKEGGLSAETSRTYREVTKDLAKSQPSPAPASVKGYNLRNTPQRMAAPPPPPMPEAGRGALLAGIVAGKTLKKVSEGDKKHHDKFEAGKQYETAGTGTRGNGVVDLLMQSSAFKNRGLQVADTPAPAQRKKGPMDPKSFG